MKKLLPIFLAGLFLLAGCESFGVSKPNEPNQICNQDAKVCPDGSTAQRAGPNCEFSPCPAAPAAADPEKKYVGHSADECSRIRFMCEPGMEYFSDDQGCGCQPAEVAECGFVNGEQKNCSAGQICATFEGESAPRCYPENPCAVVSCPAGTECVVMESWPAQIRCVSADGDTPANPDQPVSSGDTKGGVACTMEAKECPDGSYVGRTGPNCEFAPCPGE